MQQIDTQAVDLLSVNTSREETYKKLLAELVAAIRIDELPTNDTKRLAPEGSFYPLTCDKDGNIRVVPPDWIKVETKELEVLLRIEALLEQQRDLLLKIV